MRVRLGQTVAGWDATSRNEVVPVRMFHGVRTNYRISSLERKPGLLGTFHARPFLGTPITFGIQR
jgi:hypothetical protein